MSMSIKKRLAIGGGALATVGAATTLVAGVTFGLFSATPAPSGTNTFIAGGVSIGNPMTAQCNLTTVQPALATAAVMAPGDSSSGFTNNGVEAGNNADTACTFSVTYTGNTGAFIGLTAVTGDNLYTGTRETALNGATAGLQYQISDGTNSYTTGGVLNNSGGLSTAPLFVANDTGKSNTYTFTVNYLLPLATNNSFQGDTATLKFTVYAVQDSNNGTAGTPGTSTGDGVTSWS